MADESPRPEPTPDAQSTQDQATLDRRGGDRRQSVVDTRTEGNGFERRRGPGRRRSDFVKAADEGELTDEQFLFIKAMDAFKRANQKPYPSWTDVLEVIRKLGYRKTTTMTVSLAAAQDWTEQPDAPAFSPSDSPAKAQDASPQDETDDPETTGVSFDELFDE